MAEDGFAQREAATRTHIGDRLRSLREAKHLSQGDVERRTGLKRFYVSRVENGYTIPSVATLEKWARALEIRLYQLFYDGEEPPEAANPDGGGADKTTSDGRKVARFWRQLLPWLSRLDARHRRVLLALAHHLAGRKPARRN